MRVSTLILAAIIITLAAGNLVLYSGVVQGERAISFAQAASRGVNDGAQQSATPPARSGAATAAQRAEADDGGALPGRFVPTQGRQHTSSGYPLPNHVPFCPAGGVIESCYASNPPTSGMHLPVQASVQLDGNHRIRIPPDPGVYDFPVPRESIPHLEEHAGVYVGYQCQSDACATTVERLKGLVDQENSLGARVVMSPDLDLPGDTLGLAAWTRVDAFLVVDDSDDRVRRFIKAHSCRFDPEKFCPDTPVN